MLVSGRWDVWEENMRENVANMTEAGVDTVITSCPACLLVWKTYYPQWCEKLGIEYDIQAKHYSELLAEEIRAGRLGAPRRAGHEGHLPRLLPRGSRLRSLRGTPRELLQAIPGLELRGDGAQPRGGPLLRLGPHAHRRDAGRAGDRRACACRRPSTSGVNDLVALCPCCQFQLRVSADKTGLDVKVHDLAHLAAKSLGVELPDYHDACLASWRVFDQMIILMKPENMAAVMEDVFPR